jgi:hypothetical protein
MFGINTAPNNALCEVWKDCVDTTLFPYYGYVMMMMIMIMEWKIIRSSTMGDS